MFVFGTLMMVGNSYDIFLYTGRFVEVWGALDDDPLFNGLNLAAGISFACSIFFQDSILVS
jgi:hypothetical protein